MNEDQRARFQRILEDAHRGLLSPAGIKIGREIEENPTSADVDAKLCLLERMLLDRYRSAARTLNFAADAAIGAATTAENKLSAKFDTANRNRTTKAGAWWAPWQRRWLEHLELGKGRDQARRLVCSEIKHKGAWKGDGDAPSWSTLKARLK